MLNSLFFDTDCITFDNDYTIVPTTIVSDCLLFDNDCIII